MTNNKNIIIIVLIVIFTFISSLMAMYLPIYIKSNEVLNIYTTASNDPKNFDSGININTGIPYNIHICWSENTFKYFMNPRLVVIHSNYKSPLGGERTRVNVIEYKRNFLSLELNGLYTNYLRKDFEYTNSKFADYCSVDLDESFNFYSKSDLEKYKSEAQKTPKQQVPESTLTQEQIRQQIEEQEKDDSSR